MGNWIYYYCSDDYDEYIGKIRTDGTDKIKLMSYETGGSVNSRFFVVDGWIYYLDKDGVMRISTNGDNKSLVLSDDDWHNFLGFYVSGDYVYCTIDYEHSTEIYKMRADGTGEVEIIDLGVSGKRDSIIVIDDWIYYQEVDIRSSFFYEDFRNYSSIFKIKTDGTEKTEIVREDGKGIAEFNIIDDYIYYVTSGSNGLPNGEICKISTMGTDKAELLNKGESCANLNIISDWIYFDYIHQSMAGYRTKKMRTDGTEMQSAF